MENDKIQLRAVCSDIRKAKYLHEMKKKKLRSRRKMGKILETGMQPRNCKP